MLILVETNRHDGEKRFIPEDDPDFDASIFRCASHLGIIVEEVMWHLESGEELVGSFFIRKLIEE